MHDQRIDADTNALLRQTTTRRAAPRNGHHQNGKQQKKSRNNRFVEFNPFVDQHMAKLKSSEVLVWIVIWRDVDNRTGLASVSHNRIAERAGLKRRAAINAVNSLVQRGYLQIVSRGGPNGSTNTYRPTLPS